MPLSTHRGFTHVTVQTPDLSVHVAETDESGRPLLLLHGIGMDWRVWHATSRRLRQVFRVYMMDMRGHGASEKPEHGYTLAHYAADVEDVLDRLALEDVTLVGSSLGGAVAACVEAPVDLVSSRILVDPPLTGGPIRDAEGFRRILHLKHEPPHALAQYLCDINPGLSPHLARVMSDMWHEAADGVIVDMLSNASDYFAIDAALRAIDAPVLLMQADPTRGAALTDAGAERALGLLPRGDRVTVSGAGHAIHADAPDAFARLVREFAAGAEGA